VDEVLGYSLRKASSFPNACVGNPVTLTTPKTLIPDISIGDDDIFFWSLNAPLQDETKTTF